MRSVGLLREEGAAYLLRPGCRRCSGAIVISAHTHTRTRTRKPKQTQRALINNPTGSSGYQKPGTYHYCDRRNDRVLCDKDTVSLGIDRSLQCNRVSCDKHKVILKSLFLTMRSCLMSQTTRSFPNTQIPYMAPLTRARPRKKGKQEKVTEAVERGPGARHLWASSQHHRLSSRPPLWRSPCFRESGV